MISLYHKIFTWGITIMKKTHLRSTQEKHGADFQEAWATYWLWQALQWDLAISGVFRTLPPNTAAVCSFWSI